MLVDRHYRILTAFVDGELDARQEAAIHNLLRLSAEARQVLQELQDNAQSLRDLPRPRLEPGFADAVIKEIEVLGLVPTGAGQPVLAVGRTAFPSWLGAAAAAAILIGVTLASFWYFAQPPQLDQGNPVIVQQQPADQVQPHPLAALFIDGTFQDLDLTGFRLALRDLDADSVRQRVAKEYHKDNSLHLEILAGDHGLALTTLLNAFTTHKVQTYVDDRARGKVDASKNVLVYAENIDATSMAKILKQLGSQINDQEDQVLVSAVTTDDRNRLSRWLGSQEGFAAPPPILYTPIQGPPAKKDNKGKGEASPPTHLGDPMALVVVLDGETGSVGPSAQISRFLNSRRLQRPGTVQFMVRVRARA